jgi:uncharacterized protein YndB with AHSA1/START domain
MITFANTIDIDRQLDEVYDYLVDLEHVPEWNWAISSTRKVTPGPVGVGTQYRQERSVPSRAVEMIEVTRLEPPRRVEVTGRIGPFDAQLTYELAPTNAGTRLTNTAELEPTRPFGLVGGIFAGPIKASVGENLMVLKSVLESRPR